MSDAFNSINSKYNNLSSLKQKSTEEIVNQYDTLTSDQKNYLEQNNANFAAAKAKVEAKNKVQQINDTINGKVRKVSEELKSQFAE
jgi:hypothetical protein